MHAEHPLAAQDRRNLWAYAGLWLVLTSWALLGVRIMAGQLGGFDNILDWLYVLFVGGAMLVATAGVAAIRKRGEPVLAITVLAFTLVLPGLYFLFFLLLGTLFSGETVD